jgi:hypothetical protein
MKPYSRCLSLGLACLGLALAGWTVTAQQPPGQKAPTRRP